MAHYSNGGYSGDEHDSRSDSRPGSDLGDKPTYLLEHLATFTVNQESGIVYPADGMRRLLQLEKTTGIWSQKMQLCLDKQWILIMDYESGVRILSSFRHTHNNSVQLAVSIIFLPVFFVIYHSIIFLSMSVFFAFGSCDSKKNSKPFVSSPDRISLRNSQRRLFKNQLLSPAMIQWRCTTIFWCLLLAMVAIVLAPRCTSFK